MLLDQRNFAALIFLSFFFFFMEDFFSTAIYPAFFYYISDLSQSLFRYASNIDSLQQERMRRL